MNLYADSEPPPAQRDPLVSQASHRARLRRAQRLLDEADEQRDVAFLTDLGLSIRAVAECTLLGRRQVERHLAAWSHRSTDSRRDRQQRASEAIASIVVDEDDSRRAIGPLTQRS